MTFLTILTRAHPARPRCLERNIKSVKSQTDGDIQHLLLRPEIEPRDTSPSSYEAAIQAGPLIHWAAPKVHGRYVMTLDDDDRIRTPDFVRELKAIADAADPDMIIFRCALGARIVPPDDYWAARSIVVGHIAGPNVAVRREIYDQASREWLRPEYGADFYYIETAFKLSKRAYWWDYIGTESQGAEQNSLGQSEDFIRLRVEA
jgi:hypothetical protein